MNDELKDYLDRKFEEIKEMIQGKPVAEVMTVKEAAEYLSIPDQRLYCMQRRGEIPALKIGASVRFSRAELDRWIQKHRTTTKEDIEHAARVYCTMHDMPRPRAPRRNVK